jgi:hypothetical protein
VPGTVWFVEFSIAQDLLREVGFMVDQQPLSRMIDRQVLTADEFLSALKQKTLEAGNVQPLGPCQLVYRNYWWQEVQGPGVIQEEHEFGDGSGPDPEFDFLTVSMMGWNIWFENPGGKPAPFPQYRMYCNVGEKPMSRRYFLWVGFLDEEARNGPATKNWTAFVQIGFSGWKFVTH